MKKILSVLMVLSLMLLPMAALAEADDYEVYIYEDESAGFAYPNDWLLISREVIEEALEAGYTAGDGGMGDLVAALKPQMEQMDLVMVMSPDTADNINVVRMDVGAETTDEQLLESAIQFQQMMAAIDPEAEFASEPELTQFAEGGRSFAVTMFSSTDTEGTPVMMIQALAAEGTMQYTFTLTLYSTDDTALEIIEVMELVLGTFTTL